MTGNAQRRKPSDDSPGGGLFSAGPVLDQVFDGDSLYALRAAVAAHGMQAGLAEGRVDDLVLAVHELAANAVRHGAGRGRLRVWNAGGVLRCQVTDDGAPQAAGLDDAAATGADDAAATGADDAPATGADDAVTGPDDAAAAAPDPAPPDPARWTIEPGHGLWMIRQVADQASLQGGSAGTVAEVSFTLGPVGQPPPFRLARRLRDGCTVLSATGQLDLGSARRLTGEVGDVLAAVPAVRLVLDLSGVTDWDSAGLTALITAQQLVSGRPGARMIVAAVPGHLGQRLRDSGLADRFTLAPSVAAALGMYTRPA